MWFEMQYHINQSLNVTVPIPAAFTQTEGKAAVMLLWLRFFRFVHKFVFRQVFNFQGIDSFYLYEICVYINKCNFVYDI